MCGIIACYKSTCNSNNLRKKIIECGKKIQHRGPDSNGINFIKNGIVFLHERLSIIDPESGFQPFDNSNIVLTVNGEIYNYLDLKRIIYIDYEYKTNSDCEVIIPLYLQYGIKFIKLLSGMFSFILYDKNKGKMYAVRDHMGITPLYYGYSTDGGIWFSSELKALVDTCVNIKCFPPGNYYDCENNTFTKWYNYTWSINLKDDFIFSDLKDGLTRAVLKRTTSDVPWGVLLSGGLDSSLVSSIICKNFGRNTVHSFSIGLEDSPDIKAAQEVADFIGTIHHSYTYTIEEGIDALENAIYHLETYDVTTIRASIPMFLLSRKIKALGIKMVLSGEGADEIFGGYLYFHKAPDAKQFHTETMEKLKKLHLYDCLRANKSSAAWGVEVRVPFLDKDFINMAMSINPIHKMVNNEKNIEKYILRKSFDDIKNPYLPDSILWRQKEQFSDGVGHSWINGLKKYAEKEVTNKQMKLANIIFPYNTPKTKEAYLYRNIFTKHFPLENFAKTVEQEDTIACSTAAATKWCKSFKNNLDPSGRSVNVYQN